ncbi:hypothetical protein FTUN_4066 [Frigoriglobus tundricola]|uniref:DUF4381 domain-containing protein n=1 Tax=Frigoriglobus tundricola TaxID=2774151 RepID=A0A6M5YRD4_9BACT|nr:hypothetical protein FTUN_4066 [Frigoriglobus tundricola]
MSHPPPFRRAFAYPVSARPALAGLVLVLGLAGAAAGARPAGVTTDARADRDRITLSGTVRITLAVEGPAPLRVELPKQLLTADADTGWRIRPDGSAAITPAANGRERWQQVYRLDPYTDGAPLVVSFSPVTVNDSKVAWPAVPVTVTRTVSETTAAAARPVTPPEDVPRPTDPPPDHAPAWAFALGPVCVVLLMVVWVRRRRPKPMPPDQWALAALTKLSPGGLGGAEVAERVAAILRAFVERRFLIPAPTLTTAELSVAAEKQGWPVEQAEPLGALLDECDRAKFAGDVPDDDGCRRLVRLAIDWVHDVGRPAGPR